jgi:uncharacterized membrane protein YphA (DoxX/SURF4 family)
MFETLARLGRVFFGISLAAFGIQQLLWGDFVAGRARAFPAMWSGRVAWAGVSGAVLILCGAAIVAGRRLRLAGVTVAVLIFLWAVLRNMPAALADRHYGGAWTALGKGLALTGGGLAVAALPRRWTYVARVLLGAFLISSGIQHFLFVPFVATLVPAWVGAARFWTYFAGVALIAGGLGIIVPWTTRLAGALSGLMIFLWFVMLHIPRALAATEAASRRNEWTAVFEALAMSGIALVLVGDEPGGRFSSGGNAAPPAPRASS